MAGYIFNFGEKVLFNYNFFFKQFNSIFECLLQNRAWNRKVIHTSTSCHSSNYTINNMFYHIN